MHRPRFPHYFSHGMRHQISELYASTAIADLALAMVLLFEPIYFVSVLGWSVSKVLWFFAAIYGLYTLLMPIGGYLAAKVGYEHAMAYSIPFQIGYWLLLFGAAANPALIPWAVAALVIEKILFWPAFHADLAQFSDSDQRGRESSGIYALVQIAFIIGPFLGGLISHKYGLNTLLVIASAIYFLMFIPLFTTPERVKNREYKFRDTYKLYKSRSGEMVKHLGFGEELITLVVWPLFIFTVVPHFFKLGVLIGVSTLIAVILMLYAGKKFDVGEGKYFVKTGSIIASGVWALRSLSKTFWAVGLLDILGRIGRDLFYAPVWAYIYNQANSEGKVLSYVIFAEQTLALAKFLAAALGAVLFTATQSYIPLFILGALFSLLYIYPRKTI